MPVPLIQFYMQDVRFILKQRLLLKSFIQSIFDQEHKSLKNLSYIFCRDEYLLAINQQYLHHDTLTDIITFDLSDNQLMIEGEIYISIDRVRENAKLYQALFETELHRVMFHGALHLCGYNDKSEKDKKQMRNKEDAYLQLFAYKK